MLSDLIPCIHKLRNDEKENELNEEDEIEKIITSLKNLEFLSEDYEKFELVKNITNIIESFQISQNNDKDDINQNLNRKGISIENVRMQLLKDLIPSINSITDIEYLNTIMSNNQILKKHKSKGYFASFNFDDLPMIEPLELTLKLLRNDIHNEEALLKLFQYDPGELIEHPQWMDLIELLYQSITTKVNNTSNNDIIILVIKIHMRFVSSFNGLQSIDLISNILKYLFQIWSCNKKEENLKMNYNFMEISRFSNLTILQLESFTNVISTISKNFSSISDKVVDSLISSIMLILSYGILDNNSNHDLTEEIRYISILDAIRYINKDNGLYSFISDFHLNWLPFSIISHSIHSGLIFQLISKIRYSNKRLNKLELQDITSFEFNSYLFQLSLWLSLLNPFFHNNILKLLCVTDWSSFDEINNILISSSSTDTDTALSLLWNGNMDNSTNLPSMDIMSNSNKKVTLLSGAYSIYDIFLENKLNNKNESVSEIFNIISNKFSVETKESIDFQILMVEILNSLIIIIGNNIGNYSNIIFIVSNILKQYHNFDHHYKLEVLDLLMSICDLLIDRLMLSIDEENIENSINLLVSVTINIEKIICNVYEDNNIDNNVFEDKLKKETYFQYWKLISNKIIRLNDLFSLSNSNNDNVIDNANDILNRLNFVLMKSWSNVLPLLSSYFNLYLVESSHNNKIDLSGFIEIVRKLSLDCISLLEIDNNMLQPADRQAFFRDNMKENIDNYESPVLYLISIYNCDKNNLLLSNITLNIMDKINYIVDLYQKKLIDNSQVLKEEFIND
jgi:hypothetical protein